jgi:O-antigen ligase
MTIQRLIEYVLSNYGLSGLTFLLIVVKPQWIIVYLPFLFIPGSLIVKYLEVNHIDSEFYFFAAAFEFILCLILFVKYSKYSTKLEIRGLFWTIAIPCSSLPALFLSENSRSLSVFVFILMILATGLYGYFIFWLKNADDCEKVLKIALIALLFVCFLMKVTNATVAGLDVIKERSGFYGDNHIFGWVLLLFSAIKSWWLAVGVTLFFLVSLSRGIYLSWSFFVCLWLIMAIVSTKNVLSTMFSRRTILAISIAAAILVILLTSGAIEYIIISFFSRFDSSFRMADAIPVLNESFADDGRNYIFQAALDMASKYSYLGTGLGSFFEFSTKAGLFGFSNAHNLFLTSLVEGGALHFIVVVCFYFYLLVLSFEKDKTIFAAIVALLIYNMYSGELYETSGGRLSLIDYYYHIFILAYLSYSRVKKVV